MRRTSLLLTLTMKKDCLEQNKGPAGRSKPQQLSLREKKTFSRRTGGPGLSLSLAYESTGGQPAMQLSSSAPPISLYQWFRALDLVLSVAKYATPGRHVLLCKTMHYWYKASV